jgi:hypothetical protein
MDEMSEQRAATPWQARDEVVLDADDHHVADCGYLSRPYGENKENAAFIARACNAHDALVAALTETLNEAIGWYDYSTGGNPDHLEWAQRARAALANAGAA